MHLPPRVNHVSPPLSKGVAIVYHPLMAIYELPTEIRGLRTHLIGIKGTGMCAFAELLSRAGAVVGGSDVADVFYTDEILASLGLPVREGFDERNIPPDTDLVIHSAAYSAESNGELAAALRRGLPVVKYTDALGAFSARFDSSAISGVHGKTTTTAIAGTLARAAGLPAQILAGSAVGDFGGRSTLCLGDRFFIAETCEYRKHFLSFRPNRIVVTSVESDHQDFFPTYESMRDAFLEFVALLPEHGALIYCADDPGSAEIAERSRALRADLRLIPYGEKADGPFRMEAVRVEKERTIFRLAGYQGDFRLRVPGKHTALDAAAALALTIDLVRTFDAVLSSSRLESLRAALEGFRGSRRRAEIVGEEQGILVMDDYAHHPTAIKTTLEGLKAFYPDRRLIVSFMSHTYTRTAALLDEFAASLIPADEIILHKIYASAREKYSGGVDGRTLYHRAAALGLNVSYIEEHENAVADILPRLREGDLFVTMGAGDNWKLGRALLGALRARSAS